MGGSQSEGLGAGQLRLLLSSQANRRDAWHSGDRRVAGPDDETSSFLVVPEISVGLGRGLDLGAALPWARSRARSALGEEKATGFGDALARLVWHGALRRLSFSLTAGAYLPVGDLGADELPTTASFSTGTWDPLLGASLSGPAAYRADWFASASWRLIVAGERDGVERGSSFSGSLGLSRSLVGPLAGSTSLIYLHRQSDVMVRMMPGHHLEDSGGEFLYLEPSLAAPLLVRPTFALQATAGTRIPLIQDVVGTQLVESTSWFLALAQTWDFVSRVP